MNELFTAAQAWIDDDPDEVTREQASEVLSSAQSGDAASLAQLRTWFGPMLQFGTAGLRGPIGPGPSCMNRALVLRAAKGLVDYLVERGGHRIVVGYDARHRSIDFALDTVAIAAAAGLEAVLLPRTLPTPVLAFAVRHLQADAGVMVTASHNPPQDNGYKVYLGNGSQIVPPADSDIADKIAAVTTVSDLPLSDAWITADESVIDAYVDATVKVASFRGAGDLHVASTSLHGVGHEIWTRVFAETGLGTLDVVAEQAEPDADFPTVAFPNPEEAGATDLLLELAERNHADLAIANDPDADRCAAAICGRDGKWRLLRGDEVGVLLGWWTIQRRAVLGLPAPTGTFAASIVSSTWLAKIAAAAGLKYEKTLTGFKWIARVPGLVFGYEEALGYCVDPDNVSDKDGISAAVRLCELAAYLKSEGRDFESVLAELAATHGLHQTDQLSVRMADLAAIPAAVARLRANPPKSVGGLAVVEVIDLANGYEGLPPTDGILLRLDGGQVIARPSGTEPKLKCYLEVVVPGSDYAASLTQAKAVLAAMKPDMAQALGV